MSEKGMERRLFPRRLTRTEIIFEDEFGEGLIRLYAENISLGGLFISSEIPIKVGSYVFLSFYLPDSKMKIRATGQVVRVTRLDASGPSGIREGMGVRFVGLSQDAAKAIQEYVT